MIATPRTLNTSPCPRNSLEPGIRNARLAHHACRILSGVQATCQMPSSGPFSLATCWDDSTASITRTGTSTVAGADWPGFQASNERATLAVPLPAFSGA